MDVIKEINTEITNLRRVIYFLENPVFKRLYKECSDVERACVDNAIYLRDIHGIKRWIDEHRAKSLDTMSLGDLREVARGLNVYGWHRCNKDQLIANIINKRKGKNDNSGRSAAGGLEIGINEKTNPETTATGEPEGGISTLQT